MIYLAKYQKILEISLIQFRVNDNKLTGPISREIGNLENLDALDLGSNQISGNVPPEILGCRNLTNLDLHSNLITENFPGELSRLVLLQFVDFSDNLIEGTWPLHVLPRHIVFFSISRNNLSGEIASLFCNLNLINYLDFSHNHFRMIPLCLGNISDLINLDLRNNNLHGTIPKFVSCSNLRSLKLTDNQLEGSLPRSLVNCKKLKILDVSNNKVNDTFPCWLVNLLELRVLFLRSNNFHGSIGNHKTKFSFPNLRIIDLSHNMFCGHLPSNFFKNLTAMMNETVESLDHLKG